MMLEEALRAHTGCTCEPFHEFIMPVGYYVDLSSDAPLRERAAAGSSRFHSDAREIFMLPSHERHAMHITDEEYASFIVEHEVRDAT